MDETDRHIGRRLRRRRKLLGLTQPELAQRIKVRFQQIQKYETAENRISATRLWQLAEALSVPVGYFYEGLSSEQVQMNDELVQLIKQPECVRLLACYARMTEQQRMKFLAVGESIVEEPEVKFSVAA